jgi:hypothetical protein
MISRSSLANSGQTGAPRASDVSGESKKDVLQVCAGTIGPATQLVEGTDAADSAVREERKTITDLFGVAELMDRQEQRAAFRCYAPEYSHHVPRLSKVEAVERLVHQQNWVSRQKPERDDQAPVVAFGQGVDALRVRFKT